MAALPRLADRVLRAHSLDIKQTAAKKTEPYVVLFTFIKNVRIYMISHFKLSRVFPDLTV